MPWRYIAAERKGPPAKTAPFMRLTSTRKRHNVRLNEMLDGINTLPARLKQLRQASPMSQQELADKSGVSKNHISAIERGHTAVTMDTIVRLSWALDCSIGFLAVGQESQLLNVSINGVTYAPVKQIDSRK